MQLIVDLHQVLSCWFWIYNHDLSRLMRGSIHSNFGLLWRSTDNDPLGQNQDAAYHSKSNPHQTPLGCFNRQPLILESNYATLLLGLLAVIMIYDWSENQLEWYNLDDQLAQLVIIYLLYKGSRVLGARSIGSANLLSSRAGFSLKLGITEEKSLLLRFIPSVCFRCGCYKFG